VEGEAMMLKRFFPAVACLALAALVGCVHAPASPTAKVVAQTKVLIVVGNHKMQRVPFFAMFNEHPEITYTIANEVDGAQAWDRDDLLTYDVILIYDSQRSMTPAQKQRFLSLFEKGVGVVVLNHSLLSYQDWPEYERIVGGKYLLDTEKLPDGTTLPESTCLHNVTYPVTIVDHAHPITAGLNDYMLHDELYRGVPTAPDIHVLVTAPGTSPNPQPQAWTRVEKNSRIATIVFGDEYAYSDPNFARLLRQAIQWVGRGS
jgi:type 1 glutamine amidotransferase